MNKVESEFAKRPVHHLVYISEYLIDHNFESNDPYYDYLINYDNLKSVSDRFGIKSINNHDLEFFAKFIDDNDDVLAQYFETKDKTLFQKFKIPRISEYSVEYSVDGNAIVTEYYSTNWLSYNKDWVLGAMHQERNNGDWDFYEGKFIKDLTSDFDMNSLDIERIKEVDSNVAESVLSKLVIENTSEVVNSLDKDALLKLRNIIDRKLSSL